MIAPVLGVLSVLTGIGGGSFGVPLMTLYALPIHRAVGTASGFGMIIAVPSVLGFLMISPAQPPPLSVGAINTPAFLLAIATTFVTTPWGARLAQAMNPRPLERFFALFLLLMAANMMRLALGF